MSDDNKVVFLKKIEACRLKHQTNVHSENYNAWLDRCEQNARKGLKQLLCYNCQLWKWPEERCEAFVEATVTNGDLAPKEAD